MRRRRCMMERGGCWVGGWKFCNGGRDCEFQHGACTLVMLVGSSLTGLELMDRVHERSSSREAFFRASTFGWLPSALQGRRLKNEHDDETEIVRKSC